MRRSIDGPHQDVSAEFLAHLKRVSEEVKMWAKWEQNLLGPLPDERFACRTRIRNQPNRGIDRREKT